MFVSSISYWKSVSELLSSVNYYGKDFKLGTCKYMWKLKTMSLLRLESSMFEFVCAITDLN